MLVGGTEAKMPLNKDDFKKALESDFEKLLLKSGASVTDFDLNIPVRLALSQSLKIEREHEHSGFFNIPKNLTNTYDKLAADLWEHAGYLMKDSGYYEKAQLPVPENPNVQPFIVRLLPLPTFNAQALRTPNGAIFLIHLNLPILVHDIFFLCLQYEPFARLLLTEDVCSEMAFIDADELIQGTSTLLSQAILGDHIQYSASISQKNPEKLKKVVDYFVQCVIRFVLAHEFSHMLLGHLETKHYPRDSSDLVKKSHQFEIDADHLASNIVGGIGIDTDSDVLEQIKRIDSTHPYSLGGALFFVRVLSLLEDILALSPEPLEIEDSHPAARLRLRSIIDSFQYINRNFDDLTQISHYEDGAMIFDDAFKLYVLKERFDIVMIAAYKVWGDKIVEAAES